MRIHHLLRSIALAAATALCTAWAAAQTSGSGIRFTLTHWDNLIKGQGFPPIALGMGFDHDFNEHIGMGVEGTLLYRGLSQEMHAPKDPYTLTYDGWEAYYTENVRSWGLTYRSVYFPGRRSTYAFYLGTSIGVRHIERQVGSTQQYENYSGTQTSPTPPFRNKYEAAGTWCRSACASAYAPTWTASTATSTSA
ncbi:MAG: hypothetical protein QM724_04730 [Flavobacteriales bacterium]